MAITEKIFTTINKLLPKRKNGIVSPNTEKEVGYILEDMRAKIFFGMVFFVLGVLLFVTLKPYLNAVILAILVAALIHPIFTRLHRKLKWSPRVITSLIVAVLIAITVLLIFFVGRSLVQQALSLSSSINDYLNSGQTTELQNKIQETLRLNGVESQDLTKLTTSTLQQISGQLASFATSFIKNSFAFFVSVTIFLAGLVLLIPRMSRIKKMAVDISPLGPIITNDYIDKTRLLLRGAVVGSFFISLTASTLMGITFWLLGVPNAMLFTVLAFFLGFIPYLGTTIFTFGAAIIFVILGYYDKAVIVLLLQLLILNQLDLVFRPISMPKKVRIHPALMIIAVLAGIASFGMIGIIFGPTILVLFISSVEIYQQNYGAKSTISKSIDKQA
jgi:predicted PurR-regulated permease PerM